jgi:hypothetical protein
LQRCRSRSAQRPRRRGSQSVVTLRLPFRRPVCDNPRSCSSDGRPADGSAYRTDGRALDDNSLQAATCALLASRTMIHSNAHTMRLVLGRTRVWVMPKEHAIRRRLQRHADRRRRPGTCRHGQSRQQQRMSPRTPWPPDSVIKMSTTLRSIRRCLRQPCDGTCMRRDRLSCCGTSAGRLSYPLTSTVPSMHLVHRREQAYKLLGCVQHSYHSCIVRYRCLSAASGLAHVHPVAACRARLSGCFGNALPGTTCARPTNINGTIGRSVPRLGATAQRCTKRSRRTSHGRSAPVFSFLLLPNRQNGITQQQAPDMVSAQLLHPRTNVRTAPKKKIGRW